MDSAWIQRPVKPIQSDSDGVIIIQTDSDKFQKNSDLFSLIQNFLFMRELKAVVVLCSDILPYRQQTFSHLSRPMGKPTICIGENKDADQLRGNREADQ